MGKPAGPAEKLRRMKATERERAEELAVAARSNTREADVYPNSMAAEAAFQALQAAAKTYANAYNQRRRCEVAAEKGGATLSP